MYCSTTMCIRNVIINNLMYFTTFNAYCECNSKYYGVHCNNNAHFECNNKHCSVMYTCIGLPFTVVFFTSIHMYIVRFTYTHVHSPLYLYTCTESAIHIHMYIVRYTYTVHYIDLQFTIHIYRPLTYISLCIYTVHYSSIQSAKHMPIQSYLRWIDR